ncbi:DoxX family protein [Corallococcus carmarthensis]|uniref:DoxX family protein n=1 Tax=Corallococcus carmarthensis TaxID=2316728 RepID=A0A3A8KI84_9BACT|nr:DoxX family protein [Corallococcus carmarthensis]NOK17279.1 DoxX family protein [Corallococcus carmarthensis]RKH06789.1 DoxX family protein [Corallococcus carmarthensis]
MDATLSSSTSGVEAASKKKSFARYLPTVARVFMGLVFFVFGLNGFLEFIPTPKDLNPADPAVAFGMAMKATGFLFWLVKGTETVAGLLLLSNRFVPLALALIAPVIVNIFLTHAFLAPSGLGLAVVLLAAELFLAWSYRAVYRPMLAMRAMPS